MAIRVPLLPRWLRWSFVAAVAALIFYLSILTVPPETPVVPGRPAIVPLDKWRHFLAYAAFGGALAYATTEWSWRRRRLAALVVGTTVLYGIGIEAGQAFLPERYFALGDAWANAVGGLLVLPWFLVRPYLTVTPVGEWLAS